MKASVARSSVLGFQFAVHPENLALITAAALRSEAMALGPRVVEAVVFCVVGVSTAALLTAAYAFGGARERTWLQSLRRLVMVKRRPASEVLLVAAGLVLVTVGVVVGLDDGTFRG